MNEEDNPFLDLDSLMVYLDTWDTADEATGAGEGSLGSLSQPMNERFPVEQDMEQI